MKKMKVIQRLLLILTMTVFVIPLKIDAAETGDTIHDYDTDTSDYCLTVHNVTIGMKEIETYASTQDMQNAIIQAASPVIIVRSTWEQLPQEKLSFDFSKFQAAPSDTGYPVTVSAPAIELQEPSTITFLVKVLDDADHFATIHLTGGEDIKVNITQNPYVTLADLTSMSKEGYQFIGWYTDESLTKPFLLVNDINYEKQKVSGDMVLYPKWQELPKPTPTSTPTAVPTPEPTQEPSVSPTEVPAPSSAAVPSPVPTAAPTPSLTPAPTTPASTPNQEVISQPANDAAEEKSEEIPVYEYAVLGGLLAAAGSLSVTMFSDWNVLRWYKKKTRGK